MVDKTETPFRCGSVLSHTFLFLWDVIFVSKLIKTVKIPEYATMVLPPFPDFIEIYDDHISFEGKRDLYYKDYDKPCFIAMDFYGPVAKIKFLTEENPTDGKAKLNYEMHIFSKPAKRREEARKFAFDLYADIQKIFDKMK